VVRVDVDVDDSAEGAEELVDGEHDVVDVACRSRWPCRRRRGACRRTS
jgi:hypothetical protein